MTQNQRTILIVDDCLEDRETYRRYLLQDDLYTYTILEEEYGENGLELCSLVNPDAILLDFLLPDIDGLEFLNELKTISHKTNVPVVMLTGQGNEAIAVQAMKSGASDYLVKGNTTPESLRLAIHNVVERAHLRRQLEQSEKRFGTSVENMLDCFGIFTSVRDESGRIVDFLVEYLNAAACASNGMTKEEQIGKRLLELLPAHRHTGLFNEYCRLVETGEPLFKESFVYADTFNKQLLTRAFDIRAARLGDGFVATWRDISDRKQAQERLQLLESVIVHANDAVIITATTPIDEPGPSILYVNEAFTRMTGYTSNEVLGMSPRLLQGPKTDQVALARIRTALDARQPVEVELINYRKDGSDFWVEISITPVADATGEYTHFVAIQRDITERKLAAEALRESQQFIERIAHTIPDILYLYDLKEQRNVFVNRQCAEVLGYTSEAIEALGTEILQTLMHPDDLARFTANRERFNCAVEGEIIEFDYRMRHANGEWRWFRSRDIVFSKDPDGLSHQLLGTAQDITHRVQASEEIQRLNTQLERRLTELQTLLDVIPIGIAIAEEPECKVIRVNPFFQRMLTVAPDANAAVAGPDAEILPYKLMRYGKEIPLDALPMHMATAQGKEIHNIEMQVVRTDEQTFELLGHATPLFDEQGAVRGCLGTFMDITERKQAEEELYRREQEFKALVENSPDIIARYDSQLRYLYVNPAIESVTGLSHQTFIGKTKLELGFPEEKYANWKAALQEVFATGQERVIEFDLSASSGIRKYYQARLVPEFSQDGSITSVLAVSRDITDRKQAEEEREQLLAREQAARADAEAANRAKDDFLAMVSHDLRNPLSAILSYSQLLQTHSHRLDKDTIARALKTIERSAIFQGQLINDLLDISRITSGQLHLRIHPVDLVVVIEAAISTVSLTAQDKAIQIESVLDPKAKRVLGDRNRLQQVILNLLSNAIKFTPKGGRIQIQLTRIDEYVQVTVSDTGQGISAEFLPYVFDRFRQADNKARQQGLGLGLAIVRHLVELHEGTVHVESPGKGQGATFTIKLPSQSLFANG